MFLRFVAQPLYGIVSAMAALGIYIGLPVMVGSRSVGGNVWELSSFWMCLVMILLLSYVVARCMRIPRSLWSLLDSDGEMWRAWGIALLGTIVMTILVAPVLKGFGNCSSRDIWGFWFGAGPVIVSCIGETVTAACILALDAFRGRDWWRLMRLIGLLILMAMVAAGGLVHWISSFMAKEGSYELWVGTADFETREILDFLERRPWGIYVVLSLMGAFIASLATLESLDQPSRYGRGRLG